jgi:hypothetical protein
LPSKHAVANIRHADFTCVSKVTFSPIDSNGK